MFPRYTSFPAAFRKQLKVMFNHHITSSVFTSACETEEAHKHCLQSLEVIPFTDYLKFNVLS